MFSEVKSNPVVSLRLMDSLEEDVYKLPVVCEGSVEKCNDYARKRGYVFKPDTSLFGGYFVDPRTGNALIFT